MHTKDRQKPLSSTPQWFLTQVNMPRQDGFIEVNGAQIHYQRWPSAARQGLLFVHGHGAHCHWWDFIAPAFTSQYQVAAIDLSGNGDSDHRDEYSAPGYAEEIIAVAGIFNETGAHTTAKKPIIVGHSFGGTMTRIAAHLFADRLAAYVLVDSVITGNRGKRQRPKLPRTKRHVYGSRDEARRRFRLRPPQACKHDYVLDYIAHHGLKETPDGFEFKLDQSVFAKMVEPGQINLADAISMINPSALPCAFIYGALSRFFAAASQPQLTQLFGDGYVIAIEDARHHVFLDQPEAFIRALKTLLARLQPMP